MSARRQIIAALSEDSMGGIATLHDVAHAEQLVDAHRAEVLAEATTWLVKKAREYRATRNKLGRTQADTTAVLASKIARGAVRPDNRLMLPDPKFFEVDRTYAADRWQFHCLAVTSHPRTGEARAIGWYTSKTGLPSVEALDPDDWEHGGWAEVTEDGAA
jgi:hypothetical protein